MHVLHNGSVPIPEDSDEHRRSIIADYFKIRFAYPCLKRRSALEYNYHLYYLIIQDRFYPSTTMQTFSLFRCSVSRHSIYRIRSN